MVCTKGFEVVSVCSILAIYPGFHSLEKHCIIQRRISICVTVGIGDCSCISLTDNSECLGTGATRSRLGRWCS